MAEVVVVADDDADVARAIEINLTLEGYEVHVASDGLQALELARTLRPDLVVLDVVMPGLDGIEVCATLRADPRTQSIPVIMLTAKSTRDDRVKGLTTGADDYVAKPFEAVELVARVRGMLRRTSQMRDVSPLTGLPGNFRIAQELERLVADPESQFAVLYCDLSGFKSFNDHYGFLRGDEVIKFTADTLGACVAESGSGLSFAGHVGGDDFVLVVSPEVAEPLAQAVIERFDAGIVAFYDDEDRARGYVETENRQGVLQRYPLVAVAIGIATTAQRRPGSQWEASVVATEMKNHAKQAGKSAYSIDRRTAD